MNPNVTPFNLRLPAPKDISAVRTAAIIIHTRAKERKQVVFSSGLLCKLSPSVLLSIFISLSSSVSALLLREIFCIPMIWTCKAPQIKRSYPNHFFCFQKSPMHSFSLFYPHCISGFRASCLALPSILQTRRNLYSIYSLSKMWNFHYEWLS